MCIRDRAYGHFLDSFWSPATNKRNDEYGGSLDNRIRFSLNVVEAIRKAVGKDFIIGVRISPEISDIGVILDDSMKLVKMLRDEYIDFLHLSCWDIYKKSKQHPEDPKTLTEWFTKNITNLPAVISSGGIWSSEDAKKILKQGANPEWQIGYINNNGYTNSTAAGPADNPYHRVNTSYTDDEDYALHPTEYPGNYSESDMYQYMWGGATPGSISEYDDAHGCYTEDFIGNPVRMINDESGLSYNQAENFWENVQAECENSQAFFIDACTAFDLTSSSYAKPDSAWGGNYSWDAGGSGGLSLIHI